MTVIILPPQYYNVDKQMFAHILESWLVSHPGEETSPELFTWVLVQCLLWHNLN